MFVPLKTLPFKYRAQHISIVYVTISHCTVFFIRASLSKYSAHNLQLSHVVCWHTVHLFFFFTVVLKTTFKKF